MGRDVPRFTPRFNKRLDCVVVGELAAVITKPKCEAFSPLKARQCFFGSTLNTKTAKRRVS